MLLLFKLYFNIIIHKNTIYKRINWNIMEGDLKGWNLDEERTAGRRPFPTYI